MNKINLQEIVGGQLQAKFERSFEKVIENLQDHNTSFKVKRGITIKLDFTQNEDRDDVSVSVMISEKLAPQQDMNTKFYIGKDLKTEEVFAEEYGKQVRGQMNFNDVIERESRKLRNRLLMVKRWIQKPEKLKKVTMMIKSMILERLLHNKQEGERLC